MQGGCWPILLSSRPLFSYRSSVLSVAPFTRRGNDWTPASANPLPTSLRNRTDNTVVAPYAPTPMIKLDLHHSITQFLAIHIMTSSTPIQDDCIVVLSLFSFRIITFWHVLHVFAPLTSSWCFVWQYQGCTTRVCLGSRPYPAHY